MNALGRPVVAALLLLGLNAPARAGSEEAYESFKAGRYLEAASELQAIIDRSPNYPWGFFLLGHCMLKMHAASVAEAHFRRALELDPSRPEYYHGLGMALKEEADWARTIQATTAGLQRSQDPRVRYHLLSLRAYAWGALRKWDQVVVDLEAARRIHQEPWILVSLGKAYFNLGSSRQAIPPLLAALTAAPEDPTVLRVLAESYVRVAGEQPDMAKKRQDYAQALGYAQLLTAMVPDDVDAIHLVGRAALGAGRLEQAESVFLHVLDRDPRHCYAMVNLGRTYFAADRLLEAQASLTRAAACAPRTAVIFETLGEVYLRRGMAREAASAFDRAARLSPSEPGRGVPETIPVSAPR